MHILQEIFEESQEARRFRQLEESFAELQDAGILTPELSAKLINHDDVANLTRALLCLQWTRMLTLDVIDRLISHPNLCDLSYLLAGLINKDLLTPEFRDLLISHAHPSAVKVLSSSCLSTYKMYTPENIRLIAFHGNQKRLTIPRSCRHIYAEGFTMHFSPCLETILILTSIQADYDRIHALIPERFHNCIQPIALYGEIIKIQQQALSDLDLLDFYKTDLPDFLISHIQEYEGRLNQIPLPCHENELTQYKANLHTALAEFKEAKALDLLQDKLQRFITSAEAAISTAQATPSVHKLSLLDEKQVQIHAIQKLITWLSDDRQTLSVEEAALLGTHAVVRLLLANSRLTLPKLTELKDELWRYDQSSLHQQRFLLGLEGHSLWANRHNSPQAQAMFDRAYGVVIKP